MYVPQPLGYKLQSFTANLSQAASIGGLTYDLFTAVGDVWIDPAMLAYYMATAGAVFTSVSIQTNQTTPTILLTSVEGGVANLLSQKMVPHTPPLTPILLKSGQKIQFTIIGTTGTGSMEVIVPYLSNGGALA